MDGMARGDEDTIRRVLGHGTWAVVGLSGNQARPAYGVARFLQRQGKKVVPINPAAESVLGEQGYRSLAEVPFGVDVVDIFRRSEAAGAHVDEAIRAGARAVWLQLGVIDEDAADRAAEADLDVIMDHCPAIEWPRLGPDAD
jgi:predicted CoA-binding protein